MTPRLLAVMLALALSLLAGCNPASQVIGKWDLETEEPEQPAGGAGGAYIPTAIAGFMKPKMNLEFQPDGDLKVEARMAGESAESRGKWRYVKHEGDTMVLMVKVGEREEHELRIRIIDGNTIETVAPPVDEEDEWTEHTFKFTRRPF
jgi:VCBS repeat-containing protein